MEIRMNKKRKRQIININSELPSSIIEVIFSKLPFYNLPSCRIVCKEWNDLIQASKFDPPISNSNSCLFFASLCRKIFCVDFDPNDWKGMNTVALFNFNPKLSSVDRHFSISNSCNGLLCLSIRKKSSRKACVLNPMTNEYIRVSIANIDGSIGSCYGLGFSPKTKQYKIARSYMFRELSGTFIQISTFGTNGTNRPWKPVGFLPFLCFSDFVYFNGGLYFLTHDNNRVVYRLDVEDEKVYEISFPKGFKWNTSMVEFNGTLYQTTYGNYDDLSHVWKMREDFSWMKVFVHNPKHRGERFFYPIKVFEDKKILCKEGFDFVLYDLKFETKLILRNQDIQVNKEWMDFNNNVTHLLWHSLQNIPFLQISSFSFNSLSKILAGSD